jgi:hypothetical protein
MRMTTKTKKGAEKKSKKKTEKPELSEEQLEKVSGGALNAYLTFTGQKSGQVKGG